MLLEELAQKYDMSASGIWRVLKRNGVSHKKKTLCYKERDEKKRDEFLSKLLPIALKNRVYIDESGFEKTLQRSHGWSTIRTRLLG